MPWQGGRGYLGFKGPVLCVVSYWFTIFIYMSEETELIKERLDIATVVGEYVRLKSAGKSMKGLCPFHNEKSPSFIVSPGRNTWHCFGCNEGGDVFSFIQKIEGLDFPGALKMLAEQAGVTLKKHSTESTNARARLFDLLDQSSKFYELILQKHKPGEKALEYLKGRGVHEDTLATFHVGYAPHTWDALYKALKKKGFTDEEMISSGMIGKSSRDSLYDRFRGRIMFPVRDTQGRIVAFGGRIVPWHETGNEGKYVNSPETMLYEKRRVVYNLDRAKDALRGHQPCIVVEGYMDVVMLEQAGLRNVVATSGTAFTADHVQQLQRFTSTLHFAFDGDGAGWKATVSATSSALSSGMRVQTIVLPQGMDPADVAVKTPEKVEEIFRVTKPLTSVLLDQLKSNDDSVSHEAQLASLLPLLSHVRNPILLGELIRDVAEALSVPEGSVRTMLEKQPSLVVPASESALPAESQGFSVSVAPIREHFVLGLVSMDVSVREQVFPMLEIGLFVDNTSQKLYSALQNLAETNPGFFTMPYDTLVMALPEDLVSLVEGVVGRAQELLALGTSDPLQEGQKRVKELRRADLQSRLKLLLQDQRMRGTDQERQVALEQYRALLQELSVLA